MPCITSEWPAMYLVAAWMERVALGLGQANGQGAQGAQRQVGVVGAYGQAQGLVGGGYLFGQRGAVGEDDALHHVGVAGDVLGRGLDGEVGAGAGPGARAGCAGRAAPGRRRRRLWSGPGPRRRWISFWTARGRR